MTDKYEESSVKIVNVKSSNNTFVKINLNKKLISEIERPKLTAETI